ncbi:MAG TPA: nicotinate-nucleotide adenylyltransferase [Oceanobacillus sp.]|nr:nicotinate-nucleotide adenylyltransferase [Oceanobacillus sp.]
MLRRLGILGGTFDPPHIGHLILAEYAREALELAQVLFVPAADPPHKDDTRLDVRHRLAMVERAIEGNAHFAISMADIERPGPHYTVDLIPILQTQFPDTELYFLIGADSLRDLPKWNRPAELIRLCKLAVMRRPDVDVTPDMHEAVLPGLAARVTMIDAPLVDVSSTEIVERLQTGKSVRYVVPDAVLDYIQANGLYR